MRMPTPNTHLIRLNNRPLTVRPTQQQSVTKSRYCPTDTSIFFSISPLTRKENLALGYFSMDAQVLSHLQQQVQADPWAVNWADYFSHFFLKADALGATFDMDNLHHEDSRLHFYWDGQDWFYLYAWEAKTQKFIEVISTEGKITYFRQGQGTHTQLKTLARITTTENRARCAA